MFLDVTDRVLMEREKRGSKLKPRTDLKRSRKRTTFEA